MHGHGLLEQIAALVLVASGAFFLAAAWWARKKAFRSGVHPRLVPLDEGSASFAARAVVATLAFGAALIHLAVVPAHLVEFPPYAIAFAALTVVQVAIGIVVLRGGSDRLRWPVFVLTFGVIGVWIASRTVGLPVGPEAWHAEAIGIADVVASGFEITLVVLLFPGRGVGRSRHSADGSANAIGSLAIIPAIGLLGVTAVLVAGSALSGMADGDHHGAATPGSALAGAQHE